ncbi:MAG: glycosyltransferase family 4 protein [Anaerolineae bacterium]
MTLSFAGRLALQQRVLPAYRVPFFETLARACQGGLSLFAGQPRPQEGILLAESLRGVHFVPATNLHLFSGVFYLCYQRGLIDWLQDWDPDALIVEANQRYLATPAAVRWMHARGRPVIGWGLGAPPLSGPLAGFRQMRRRAFLSHFDALIAYSRRGAEEYARAGFPAERIFVACNAVAPPPHHPPPLRPPSPSRPTVLFVGRLQERKRVDWLLRACAALPEPAPRLIIVGDGPERPRLEHLAAQVYPSAEFVGARHGEQLTPYWQAADLFVLPGTGGLAVQEAMSFALPVIVARGDGTQDDLVRPENGWQIPPDDFPALVETLRLALADLPELRQMGAASYRIVSQEINIERMVEVFVQALQQTLS